MKDRYLGDGVYARFDGFSVWLDLRGQSGPRMDPPSPLIEICLEPLVLSELERFARDAREGASERSTE